MESVSIQGREAPLLLAIADEILESISLDDPPDEPSPDFWQALATALRYLLAAISSRKLPIRQECMARLRYCQLLTDWTTNEMEVQSLLSKGIPICDQNRLFDLKYHMQYLLAKVTYETNGRAALKQVEKAANDARLQKHITWVYVFEFLRVTFSLEAQPKPHYTDALYSLGAIAETAKKLRDGPVLAIAALTEALVVLRQGGAECVSAARDALAVAQSHQTSTWVQKNPEFLILMKIIDVSCYFVHGKHMQSHESQSLKGIHQLADKLHNQRQLKPNDRFWAPILSSQSLAKLNDTGSGGLVSPAADGTDMLAISWLDGPCMMGLTLLLSGYQDIARGQHPDSHNETPRAMNYVKNGLKVLRRPDQLVAKGMTPESDAEYTEVLQFNLQFLLGISLIMTRRWQALDELMPQIKQSMDRIAKREEALEIVHVHYQYLLSVILQARGEPSWHRESFDLHLVAINKGVPGHANPLTDFSILSVLNSLLSFRKNPPLDPSQVQQSFAILERQCAKHPNQIVRSAFTFVQCMYHETDSRLDLKKRLKSGLDTATEMGNVQLMAMMLSYMCSVLHEFTVGQPAIFSAQSAARNAGRLGDKTWMAVTEGLLADKLENSGQHAEAARHRASIAEFARGIER